MYNCRDKQPSDKNQEVGLISSDEGHQFLSSVQAKQRKRAFLFKLWAGSEIMSNLAVGSGVSKRCVVIQPQPLLSELISMQGAADGFLDRLWHHIEDDRLK